MIVETIIPWQGGCPHRERALTWVRGRSTTPIRIAPSPDGPWCKGAAVTQALHESRADIVVIHDADVWTAGLPDAIQAVKDGAAWAVPHRGVFRLDPDATERVLNGQEPDEAMPLTQPAYLGVAGGGITVLPRQVALSIPIDPRFTGWGQEDESWGHALTCLLGPPWRGKHPLWHLWHPPQQRLTRRRGSPEGWALRRRYLAAEHDPARMRALLDETQSSGFDSRGQRLITAGHCSRGSRG